MVETEGYTTTELAEAERINPSYLARVLRLTLLAPDLSKAILDGRHDPDRVALAILLQPFPLEWEKQRQMFGRGGGKGWQRWAGGQLF